MSPDADPGSIPENKFRLLVNARRKGGAIVPRGGQTKILPNPTGTGLSALSYDRHYGAWFEVSSARRLYLVATGGCLGVGSTATGLNVYALDSEHAPLLQNISCYLVQKYHDLACVAVYGDRLYLSQENRLRVITQVLAPYGTNSVSVGGTGVDQDIHAFTTYPYITWMQEFGGYLFIALGGNGAGTSKIVSYDGKAFYDELTTINDVFGMTVYGDKLIVSYAGSPNHIRVRPTGAPGVTWTTVVPGAGTVGMNKAGTSFRGNAYWIGRSGTTMADIWKFDGTTVSKARTLTGGIDLCEFNGHLFYLRATNSVVGYFDGTTWTDAAQTLSADRVGTSIAGYRGSLYVAQYKAGTVITNHLLQSPGINPFGTWVSVGDFTGTTVPIIPRQLLRW